MATLDELVVRIKADASQLERELRKVSAVTRQETAAMTSAFSGLKGQLLALVPTVTISGLLAMTKHAINLGDQINDLSIKTGVAVETISKLKLAADQSGTSLEGVATGLKFLQRNLTTAAQSGGEAEKAFTQIGVSVEDLLRLSTEDQFLLIADRISQLGTEAERTKALMDIFGRSGADLGVMMQSGAAGIREAMDEAERMGIVFTKEQASTMDEFNDKWAIMANTLEFKLAKAFVAVYDAAEKYREVLEFIARTNPITGNGLLGAYAYFKSRNDDEPQDTPLAGDEAERLKLFSRDFNAVYGATDTPAVTTQTPKPSKTVDTATSTAEKKLNDLQRERATLIERNMTAYERYMAGVQRANAVLGDDQEQLNRELTRLWKEFEDSGTDSLDAVGKSAVINANIIKDYIGDSLESAMFDFKNFGDAAGSILDGIARKIARQKIIDPLANSIGGLFDGLLSGGLNNSGYNGLPWQSFGNVNPSGGIYLGGMFADGGNPPVGVPSIVGERGPEIFVPRTVGTVIPNHALGGNQIVVTNTWNIGSGVTRQELATLMPQMEARAMAGTLAAIERGGRAAQVVGKRS